MSFTIEEIKAMLPEDEWTACNDTNCSCGRVSDEHGDVAKVHYIDNIDKSNDEEVELCGLLDEKRFKANWTLIASAPAIIRQLLHEREETEAMLKECEGIVPLDGNDRFIYFNDDDKWLLCSNKDGESILPYGFEDLHSALKALTGGVTDA